MNGLACVLKFLPLHSLYHRNTITTFVGDFTFYREANVQNRSIFVITFYGYVCVFLLSAITFKTFVFITTLLFTFFAVHLSFNAALHFENQFKRFQQR